MGESKTVKCKRCQAGVEHEWIHGTFGGYRYHGCRCQSCKHFAREESHRRYWSNPEAARLDKRKSRERNIQEYVAREHANRLKPEKKAQQKRRQEKYGRVPVTRSRNWQSHEDILVLQDGLTVLEIAYMLQRSATSISARRQWLKNKDEIRNRNRCWYEANKDFLNERRRAVSGGIANGLKTNCKRGHPYDAENTYIDPKGHRHCRACKHINRPLTPRTKKTHCPQGHPYSGNNLYIYGNGYQKCKQCDRDNHRKAAKSLQATN